MAFEVITLNLIPDGEMPIFHASQFDTARPVIIDLVMGEDAYVVPEGISVELHCRKVDDTIVTMEPDEVSESRVTFVTTEQLTACIGDNLCEVALLNGDDHIGTLNFILHVEPDPLAGGLTSESEIYNLTQQIEDIATEVIGEDYYDKTEVDAFLADKADVSDLPDMSQYYDKTATDTLLSAKADTATTYTKSETDSLLSAKANTADLATVATTGDYDDLLNKPTIPINTSDLVNDSDFQNETEVNELIADALLAVMPVDSATGNPCTFDTDIATSLVGLSADIVASGGGGTPATPIPIVGISSLDIVANGDTFTIDLGGTRYGGVYTADGKLRVTHGMVDLSDLTQTSVSSGRAWRCRIVGVKIITSGATVPNITGEQYKAVSANSYNFVTGTAYQNINLDYFEFCNNDSVNPATGKVVYELATPIEIDVSSISVVAQSGVNNISSNGNGDVTAQYKVSIQKYIDDHV